MSMLPRQSDDYKPLRPVRTPARSRKARKPVRPIRTNHAESWPAWTDRVAFTTDRPIRTAAELAESFAFALVVEDIECELDDMATNVPILDAFARGEKAGWAARESAELASI